MRHFESYRVVNTLFQLRLTIFVSMSPTRLTKCWYWFIQFFFITLFKLVPEFTHDTICMRNLISSISTNRRDWIVCLLHKHVDVDLQIAPKTSNPL